MTAGSGRSGTTLLNLILGSHSRGFALGEIAGLRQRVREPDGACRSCGRACPVWTPSFTAELARRHWGRGGGFLARLGRRPEARRLRRALSGRAERTVYDDIFDRTGATALFDQSKNLEWIEKGLDAVAAGGRARPFLLFITRDGRAVLHAVRRRAPERSAESEVERWLTQVRTLERLYEGMAPDRRARVAYEDLARDPVETTRGLCDQLGLDYEPGMERYWEHEHHAVGGNKGTHLLVHRSRGVDLEANPTLLPDEKRRAHYLEHELGVREDDRWLTEMDARDLAVFERLAGPENDRYRIAGKEPAAASAT